jgi:hypothetical protein
LMPPGSLLRDNGPLALMGLEAALEVDPPGAEADATAALAQRTGRARLAGARACCCRAGWPVRRRSTSPTSAPRSLAWRAARHHEHPLALRVRVEHTPCHRLPAAADQRAQLEAAEAAQSRHGRAGGRQQGHCGAGCEVGHRWGVPRPIGRRRCGNGCFEQRGVDPPSSVLQTSSRMSSPAAVTKAACTGSPGTSARTASR